VALADLGFEDIRTIETLLRPFDVQMGTLRPADAVLSSASGATTGDGAVTSALAVSDIGAGAKRKRDSAVFVSGGEGPDSSSTVSQSDRSGGGEALADSARVPPGVPTTSTAVAKRRWRRDAPTGNAGNIDVLMRPDAAIRGHTGYLTFATLYRKVRLSK
jgi:hypothetical protein